MTLLDESNDVLHVVRNVLGRRDPGELVQLSAELAVQSGLLPESMVLFCAHGLDASCIHAMLSHLWPEAAAEPAAVQRSLAQCLGSLGRLGFAFPRWRYLAQSTPRHPSLLEGFGMRRLVRPNDRLGHPGAATGQDDFGTGFVWEDGQSYVEYRRAYVVCQVRHADGICAVVVRNSSHFFGRDRLPGPVYACFGPLPDGCLQNLDRETLASDSRFSAWPPRPDDAVSSLERLRQAAALAQALARLDAFDQALTGWAFQAESHGGGFGGFGHMLVLLEEFLARDPSGQRMPWLVHIRQDMPPWYPDDATHLDGACLERMRQMGTCSFPRGDVAALGRKDGASPALLSGCCGDLP